PLPVCIGGTGRTRTLPMVAKYAHHWNFGGTDPVQFADCLQVLHAECDKIDRDSSEITCSALARYEGDADAMRRGIAAMEAAGCDLTIVSLRKSDPPQEIERVAAAIS